MRRPVLRRRRLGRAQRETQTDRHDDERRQHVPIGARDIRPIDARADGLAIDNGLQGARTNLQPLIQEKIRDRDRNAWPNHDLHNDPGNQGPGPERQRIGRHRRDDQQGDRDVKASPLEEIEVEPTGGRRGHIKRRSSHGHVWRVDTGASERNFIVADVRWQ